MNTVLNTESVRHIKNRKLQVPNRQRLIDHTVTLVSYTAYILMLQTDNLIMLFDALYTCTILILGIVFR